MTSDDHIHFFQLLLSTQAVDNFRPNQKLYANGFKYSSNDIFPMFGIEPFALNEAAQFQSTQSARVESSVPIRMRKLNQHERYNEIKPTFDLFLSILTS
jgi:hypothetical protein